MFVITADQDASRRSGEHVDALLGSLADLIEVEELPGVLRAFERTVGDEVQAVLTDASTTVTLTLHLQRLQEWSVGIGVGEVEQLAASSRASSGPAFIHAREAVERAGGRTVPAPVAVVGPDPERATEAEALLQLMAAVVRRRSDAGWQMIDARRTASTAREAAAAVGISPQAASQRLQAALWAEVRGVEPLAAGLLRAMDPDAGG